MISWVFHSINSQSGKVESLNMANMAGVVVLSLLYRGHDVCLWSTFLCVMALRVLQGCT